MYQHILLAYDGTQEGRLALREGARLAKVCNAKVTLLAVVDPAIGMGLAVDPAGLYNPPDQTEAYQQILDEGAARLARMGLAYEARLEKGLPAERITAVAQDIRADLVVVGHQRQGAVARWLLGSVAGALTDSLGCSLLVARMEVSDEALFGTAASSASA